MTRIQSSVVALFIVTITLLLEPKCSQAEWCEAKFRIEPEILETFDSAVKVLDSWQKSGSDAPDLGRNIAILISGYSFFIHKNDLPGFSTSTLKSLLRVVNILKADNRIFQSSTLHESKEAYLKLEDDIKKILECRTAISQKKFQAILEGN